MDYLRSRNEFKKMAIWTTDFSPNQLNDVIGNRKVCDVLNKFIETKQIPNILLTGNNGTGKRTIATLFVQSYLGEDYKRGCLKIDGAINRGKDVIACNNIKKINEKSCLSSQNVLSFAQRKITLKNSRKKIIMIYNFEDMTSEAQNALRRIIETHESTTRFVLICNNLDNIIEAIQSRCAPLKTSLLTDEDSIFLIETLRSKNGQKNLSRDIVKIITMLSSGDMKKVINFTQTISVLDDIDLETFHKIFNIPPVKILEQVLIETQDEKTQQKVIDRLKFLLCQGYTYGDILEMLSKILAYTEVISDNIRFKYLERLSEYYCNMSQQTHDVHLYSLFADFADITEFSNP